MDGVRNFQVIAKPMGPLCNLDCSYCFYLEKEALFKEMPGAQSRIQLMPDQVLENYIQKKLESTSTREHHFIWQGGEPTLAGIQYFQKVIRFQQRYGQGQRINNAIQTNGVLLDDAWCEFLAGHEFLVGISIDGPRELHDVCRVDKTGKPTFDRVMRGLELLKKHQVAFNTLTTIHHMNQDFPRETYGFLKEIGSRFMQFIPIVEKIGGQLKTISKSSVDPVQYGQFLNTVFDEWVKEDVGSIFVQNFDVALEAWSGRQSSLCVFNETCGQDPVIEHNGDLYACDHFVSPEYRIGNLLNDGLDEVMGSPEQLKFGLDKRSTLPAKCRGCSYRFACHGGCPKDRFSGTEARDPGLNYLCEGYLSFFEHIDPYMSFMANELRNRRPPATVMQWQPGQHLERMRTR